MCFPDQRVGNIMTLRKDLYYVDLKDSFKENRRKIASSPHSRIPVCKGGIDNIVGVVYAKDVLNKVMSAEEPDLAALVKTPCSFHVTPQRCSCSNSSNSRRAILPSW
ncbi:CBS domain-containing protein [Allohahella sp. A8]|uniref:CBS domain-containing protein n=1 Tax=Allohahella sp. A8 TaxID=3141461 RepID=UPI003A805DAB